MDLDPVHFQKRKPVQVNFQNRFTNPSIPKSGISNLVNSQKQDPDPAHIQKKDPDPVSFHSKDLDSV